MLCQPGLLGLKVLVVAAAVCVAALVSLVPALLWGQAFLAVPIGLILVSTAAGIRGELRVGSRSRALRAELRRHWRERPGARSALEALSEHEEAWIRGAACSLLKDLDSPGELTPTAEVGGSGAEVSGSVDQGSRE